MSDLLENTEMAGNYRESRYVIGVLHPAQNSPTGSRRHAVDVARMNVAGLTIFLFSDQGSEDLLFRMKFRSTCNLYYQADYMVHHRNCTYAKEHTSSRRAMHRGAWA
jgi:hypothetical protein